MWVKRLFLNNRNVPQLLGASKQAVSGFLSSFFLTSPILTFLCSILFTPVVTTSILIDLSNIVTTVLLFSFHPKGMIGHIQLSIIIRV